MSIAGSRRLKVSFKEGKQLLPAIDRLLLSIIRPIVVEEAMAGFRIHVERIGLAVPFEFFLEPRHLRGRGILVLLAKQAEQRAGQIFGVVNWGDGLLGR